MSTPTLLSDGNQISFDSPDVDAGNSQESRCLARRCSRRPALWDRANWEIRCFAAARERQARFFGTTGMSPTCKHGMDVRFCGVCRQEDRTRPLAVDSLRLTTRRTAAIVLRDLGGSRFKILELSQGGSIAEVPANELLAFGEELTDARRGDLLSELPWRSVQLPFASNRARGAGGVHSCRAIVPSLASHCTRRLTFTSRRG